VLELKSSINLHFSRLVSNSSLKRVVQTRTQLEPFVFFSRHISQRLKPYLQVTLSISIPQTQCDTVERVPIMAKVTSRDVQEIVEKLSSDKVKAREVIFLSPTLYYFFLSLISDFEWEKSISCSC